MFVGMIGGIVGGCFPFYHSHQQFSLSVFLRLSFYALSFEHLR